MEYDPQRSANDNIESVICHVGSLALLDLPKGYRGDFLDAERNRVHYLAGARVAEYWPLSIVQHGLGVNITVESYAGAAHQQFMKRLRLSV